MQEQNYDETESPCLDASRFSHAFNVGEICVIQTL